MEKAVIGFYGRPVSSDRQTESGSVGGGMESFCSPRHSSASILGGRPEKILPLIGYYLSASDQTLRREEREGRRDKRSDPFAIDLSPENG